MCVCVCECMCIHIYIYIRTCLRYLRKDTSCGSRNSSALPFPPARAVRPTRWMYDFGSSGGSYCTIQSTAGMSSPRAATSVQSRIPVSAEQNSKKVAVRLFCFWSPCRSSTGRSM